MAKQSILITDDDHNMREILKEILEFKGYTVFCARDGIETVKILEKNNIDAVLLDLVLPRKNGLEVLKELIQDKPHVPVIMISGKATISMAVEATKIGAYDFLEKPLDADRVLITLKNALEKSCLARQVALFQNKSYDRYNMLGVSMAMKRVYELIESFAPTNGRVLITGASGTGKELVAHSIHALSTRKAKPMVKINCAAFNNELIESELFGYKKGAFTHAFHDKDGVFQRAHGGTLFLDEIGDMSLQMQAKVLRALEEGEVQKIGSTSVDKVDARLICATNKNLLKEIEADAFREDLFYRLNVVSIHVPELKERPEDIPVLANHFMALYCSKHHKPLKELTTDAWDFLLEHEWPGNIRELKNFVERLVILNNSVILNGDDVQKILNSFSLDARTMESQNFKFAREEFEKNFILKSLKENDWNITATAQYIGFNRTQLHNKMKQLGIARQE